MDNQKLSQIMTDWQGIIESRLEKLSEPIEKSPYSKIYETVRYSLLKSGKRIRPILTLEFCRAAGGDPQQALNCACAVEMIHTYSLIHDDLPCMDDDELRRGKPSCHKVYGEAIALLAGDALQSMAVNAITSCKDVAPDRLLAAANDLFSLCGPEGMIGGQMIDICSEGKTIDLETLRAMVVGKTCALIEAACLMGCHIAGAEEEKCNAAKVYARELGIAFQIIDDILDVEGDPGVLGKPVASDAEKQKVNHVTVMGLEGARRFAKLHTDNAVAALKPFGDNAQFLSDFARYLLDRIK